MRDPNRIPEMMDLIGRIWMKYPDLRLGQLIANAVGDQKPFYIEDDEMLRGLNELVKENK